MTRTAHREMEMRNLVVPACFLLPARRIETAGGVFRAKAAFETMSLPLSAKALSATGAFLMICAALHAGSPDDLVTKGDSFDVRLEAACAS
jgi:hypothetical protein